MLEKDYLRFVKLEADGVDLRLKDLLVVCNKDSRCILQPRISYPGPLRLRLRLQGSRRRPSCGPWSVVDNLILGEEIMWVFRVVVTHHVPVVFARMS